MSQSLDATDSRRTARDEQRRRHVRAEILAAARSVVVRDGLAGFSLTGVADRVGLTKPALYYYFASREALVFELLLDEWVGAAAEVEAAVEATSSGADAVETLMRTPFSRYCGRLELFRLVYMAQPTSGLSAAIGPKELRRIRPINDMFYAGAERRLRADQVSNAFPAGRDPRLFAFTAHTAVIGLLTMKAVTESVGDPLAHRDDDLIDELCITFRYTATGGTL